MLLMPVPTLSHFNHLKQTNAMVVLMMPSVSWYATVASCDLKVIPCFNHLDLTNKMVPLTMLSVSCNAGTGAYTISWPMSQVTPCFICFHQMNKMMPLMQLAPHSSNAGINDIPSLKKQCFTSFWLLQSNECNGAIGNTIDITKICLHT